MNSSLKNFLPLIKHFWTSETEMCLTFTLCVNQYHNVTWIKMRDLKRKGSVQCCWSVFLHVGPRHGVAWCSHIKRKKSVFSGVRFSEDQKTPMHGCVVWIQNPGGFGWRCSVTPRRDVVMDGRESRKWREQTSARFSTTTQTEIGRDGDGRGRSGRLEGSVYVQNGCRAARSD